MAIFELSKRNLAGFLILTALSSGNLYADDIVLDFEGVSDMAAVSEFYNGGADSKGNSGIDLGVHFSNDAKGVKDLDDNFDFSGNFANEPSPNGVLIFREGGPAIMNVAEGFDSGLSLHYSSSAQVIVKVFDGLDGSGNQLATLILASNYKDNNCNGDPFGDYCHWDQMGVHFDGRAQSVVFEGPREFTYYDNITLGSSDLNESDVVE